jgi:hypothetical protein
MQPNWNNLAELPVRFNPPDGWRTPDPQWVSLYQGFEAPAGWQPYPGCPPLPPNWPLWEENGSSWYTFFRYHAPPPTRALGGWFAMGAAGLFTVAVSPFAFGFPDAFLPGAIALVLLIIGVRGVVRTLRRQSDWLHGDPMDRVRAWAASRREEELQRAYERHRIRSSGEPSFEEFMTSMQQWWWRESAADEAN